MIPNFVTLGLIRIAQLLHTHSLSLSPFYLANLKYFNKILNYNLVQNLFTVDSLVS